jgi:hypothetical protein
MSNAARLRLAIDEYVRAAKSSPADQVGGALERLQQVASDSRGVSDSVALCQRVANSTWMSRIQLAKTVLESNSDPILIPYPCVVVGMLPTVLLIDSTAQIVEPPLEAFDIYVQIDRRDTLTATSDRVSATTQDVQVVNLPAFLPYTALRTLELELGNTQNIIGVRLRWAVPLTIVTAMHWGDVQISMNWFIDRRL